MQYIRNFPALTRLFHVSPPPLSQSMNWDQHNTAAVHKREPDSSNAGTVAVQWLTNQVTVEIKTLWSPTFVLEVPPTCPINERTSKNKCWQHHLNRDYVLRTMLINKITFLNSRIETGWNARVKSIYKHLSPKYNQEKESQFLQTQHLYKVRDSVLLQLCFVYLLPISPLADSLPNPGSE